VGIPKFVLNLGVQMDYVIADGFSAMMVQSEPWQKMARFITLTRVT